MIVQQNRKSPSTVLTAHNGTGNRTFMCQKWDDFISSICKAFFHICDLDISSVPTNFGLGFCIEFTGTNFGSIIFY